MKKVSLRTPPDIPVFQEFLNPPLPGIRGKISQALPVRNNRREVGASNLITETNPTIPQINVTPQIFLPPMDRAFGTPVAKHRHVETPSFSPGDIVYPTIDEWLASLDKSQVGGCNIEAVRGTFQAANFSLFTIDVLEYYKVSSFGPNGSGILNQAEEALLGFRLKRTMAQLQKATKQAKRAYIA
ncbi:MAG TPA: hypothetical protein VGO47_09060 [Chlamydiales bacterium]|nr:hypothetical protein [Chlamydiales bacterium]